MPLPKVYRQNTFLILGSIFIGILSFLIFYYNYFLLKSHFTPLFWSIIWYLILKKFKKTITTFLEYIGKNVPLKIKITIYIFFSLLILSFLIFIIIVWNELEIIQKFLYSFLLILIILIFLIPILKSYEELATIIVFSFLFFFSFFVGVVLVKKCYDESLIMTNFITESIEDLRDKYLISTSTIDLWQTGLKTCNLIINPLKNYSNYFNSFCNDNITFLKSNIDLISMNLLIWIKGHLGILGTTMTSFFKSIGDFISSIGEFFFSLFLFVSFLYCFIKYENVIEEELQNLSPLSQKESNTIINILNDGVFKIFGYAFLLSTSKFFITLFSFWFVNFQILWIFAFLSGFLSIIPIFSSWLIWIPTTIYLLVRDGLWSTSWIVIIVMHTFIGITIDNLVFGIYYPNYNPQDIEKRADQNRDIVGLSIILGIYSFGWSGILLGPLICSCFFGIFEIYKNYQDQSLNLKVSSFRNESHSPIPTKLKFVE